MTLENEIEDVWARKQLVDPVHDSFDLFDQPITKDVWESKYKYPGETSPHDTFVRVAKGVYKDDSDIHRRQALKLMEAGLWMPAGRILAGAGTAKDVTLMNCYVNGILPDSMEGIADGLRNIMLTLKHGGGIGTDFSPLRYRGAELKHLGAGAESSGAVSFMHVWDAASQTIKSAGARRGAMMGTIRCDHPDLLEFIKAKQTKGSLESFNVSVLVTDDFMQAVKEDLVWRLYSVHKPADESRIVETYSPKSRDWTHYTLWKGQARELWDLILKSTYEYSEPGVIFIDRINDWNNLQYCEQITCTNPCGEQPLPPHGACNLGAINLARMVRKPFTDESEFDWPLLRATTQVGVRFLDNVIDICKYPLDEQANEQKQKRRIGLGISGLANALDMVGLKYGSKAACALAHAIMKHIAEEAYDTSIKLAQERGAFPLLSISKYLESKFIQHMPLYIREGIAAFGIRNSVLLTIAPTGTTSILFGNISSGVEPVFSHKVSRNVRQADNTYKKFDAWDYGYLIYYKIVSNEPIGAWLPADHMVSADQINPRDHVMMQAACQEWVDASVSKTINCSKDITYENFKAVYEQAYENGCKGCTTYRPSEMRGSILNIGETDGIQGSTAATEDPQTDFGQETHEEEEAAMLMHSRLAREHPEEYEPEPRMEERPLVLMGKTYKLKWPDRAAIYFVINNDEYGNPYECFLVSRVLKDMEWMVAVTRMISAMLRMDIDIDFICEELKQVHSAYDSAWVGGKRYGSIVHWIGETLQAHALLSLKPVSTEALKQQSAADPKPDVNHGASARTGRTVLQGALCPKCQEYTLVHTEGCKVCTSCGYSSCE